MGKVSFQNNNYNNDNNNNNGDDGDSNEDENENEDKNDDDMAMAMAMKIKHTRVKNRKKPKANPLVIYKHGRGIELATTKDSGQVRKLFSQLFSLNVFSIKQIFPGNFYNSRNSKTGL